MTDTHHDDPGTIHGAIAIVAALDTKGEEAAFVRDQILGHRHATIFIDTGIVGEPRVPLGPYDVPAPEVARAAGTTLQALRDRADRGEAVPAPTVGVTSRDEAEHLESTQPIRENRS